MASALAHEALNGVYDALGVSAKYIPAGGDPIDVKVLPDAGDGEYTAFGASVTADRLMFKLRRSEVDPARRGDRIDTLDAISQEVDGSYVINGAPRLTDIEQIEWTLELVPISQ